MLSKNKIKLFNALKKKKHRDNDQLFIVEGEKVVYEILKSDFEIELMVSTEQWLRKNQGLIYSRAEEVISIESTDIQKISSFKSPGEVLAIIKMPKQEYDKKEILDDISIVLDNVQDPGNIGTLIRTADWFGIKNIICSTDSVDVYNPKVIRATMGSICRVKIHYLDLEPFLHEYSSDGFPIYGT
ncbi:MAG: TrmH family RNA methyltransferase, partial [bacterium]